jgi:hypothetical protein
MNQISTNINKYQQISNIKALSKAFLIPPKPSLPREGPKGCTLWTPAFFGEGDWWDGT